MAPVENGKQDHYPTKHRRAMGGMSYAVAILLLWSGIAFSQPPEEKNEHKDAVPAQSTQGNKTGGSSPSVVVNVTGNTQTVENSCKAGKCNKDPEDWLNKLWSDPVATFTGLLFIATAALIITGGVQWWETRGTAKRQLRAYVMLDDIYFPYHRQSHPQEHERSFVIADAIAPTQAEQKPSQNKVWHHGVSTSRLKMVCQNFVGEWSRSTFARSLSANPCVSAALRVLM